MATRSHGCYCKICGQYKSNESFSGKGHAEHICKTCSRLPAAEKAKQETLNRLVSIAYRNTSAADEKWLRNRLKDERPEIARLAKEAYAQLHLNASRNAMKNVLVIDRLVFEVNTEVPNEWGDFAHVERRFEVDRIAGWLRLFDVDDMREVRLPNATKMLRWVVHTLELFMWPKEYGGIVVEVDDVNTESDGSSTGDSSSAGDDALLDDDDMLLDDAGVEDTDTVERIWTIRAEYSNHMVQDFWSMDNELPDHVWELYDELAGFFDTAKDTDEEETEDQSDE